VVGGLYFAVAAASLLVLGPAAGSTEAPLAELLAIGVGGEVRMLTAGAAVLLTLGAMNAYFAGAAKLGAALGRDGALPAWFAQGSSAGDVPRRSLAVVASLSTLSLAVMAVSGLGARPLVLITTGAFVLVYVLGTAAAVRLLPRGTLGHRGAVVALVSVAALALMTGIYMLWTLAIAAAALTYDRRRRHTPDRQPVLVDAISRT
jgi:amino acid efflux transporter